MKLKIKICGMKYPDNINEVLALEPDFMGFIFYPKSRRFVGEDFMMPSVWASQTKRVGVFVNQSLAYVLDKASHHQLTYIQLHGSESPEHCLYLRNKGYCIIKAFGIHPLFNFEEIIPYLPVVDYFLFDTHTPEFGGSGKSFNWATLDQYTFEKPFFLSGGLSAALLRKQKLPVHPQLYALDINSSVEDRPGVKNPAAVQELMNLIANTK